VYAFRPECMLILYAHRTNYMLIMYAFRTNNMLIMHLELIKITRSEPTNTESLAGIEIESKEIRLAWSFKTQNT